MKKTSTELKLKLVNSFKSKNDIDYLLGVSNGKLFGWKVYSTPHIEIVPDSIDIGNKTSVNFSLEINVTNLWNLASNEKIILEIDYENINNNITKKMRNQSNEDLAIMVSSDMVNVS